MTKLLSILLTLFTLIGVANATTVSGTIRNSNAVVQPLGTVVFTAVGCPVAQMTIISSGALVTPSYTFTANSSGVWSGTVLGNNLMTCPGSGVTQYKVSEYSATGLLLVSNLFTLVDTVAFSPDTATPVVNPGQPFLTNPFITRGDIIIAGLNGVPIRLPIGANGTYLGSNGTSPSWQSISGSG